MNLSLNCLDTARQHYFNFFISFGKSREKVQAPPGIIGILELA